MTVESTIRLGAFVASLGLMLVWEVGVPRLPRRVFRWRRWSINVGLGVLGMVLVRFTVGALAFGAAHWAQSRGWGLFNIVRFPLWLRVILAFFLLDFGVYVVAPAGIKSPVRPSGASRPVRVAPARPRSQPEPERKSHPAASLQRSQAPEATRYPTPRPRSPPSTSSSKPNTRQVAASASSTREKNDMMTSSYSINGDLPTDC